MPSMLLASEDHPLRICAAGMDCSVHVQLPVHHLSMHVHLLLLGMHLLLHAPKTCQVTLSNLSQHPAPRNCLCCAWPMLLSTGDQRARPIETVTVMPAVGGSVCVPSGM